MIQRAANAKPTIAMQMKVIPNVRLIPFSSSAPQYWEKNRIDALAKPQ